VVDNGSRVVLLALADPSKATPLVLEGPAAAVWHALQSPRTTAEVVRDVSADFGLPAAEVEHDVTAFLSELAASGLIRPAGPDTSPPS
jgi:hypothetical protein